VASLPVNDGLHKDLKVDCVENDHTMKEVVNELVKGYLEDDLQVMDD
jgi:hypothetical protein